MTPDDEDFRPAGFAHVRAAVLPWSSLGDVRAAPDLRSWAREPVVQEALTLASPSLAALTARWADDPVADDPALETTLARYRARMEGRPTPFGLFATTSTVALGPEQSLRLGAAAAITRDVEVDAGIAQALAFEVLRGRGDATPLAVNPCAYRRGTQLRCLVIEGTSSRTEILELDLPLSVTIETAGRPDATVGRVTRALAEAVPDTTVEERQAYVGRLLSRGVLAIPSPIPVTGPTAFAALRTFTEPVTPHTASDPWMAQADVLRTVVRDAPLGAAVPALQALARHVSPDASQRGLPLLQVDARRPSTGTIAVAVADELLTATRVLRALVRPRTPPVLVAFRERFEQRYGNGPVPLLEAMDDESGLPFDPTDDPRADGAPLLAGLDIQHPVAAPMTVRPMQQWLMSQVADALHRGLDELQIDPRAVEAWASTMRLPPPQPLPDCFAAVGTVIADSPSAVTAGRFRILHLGAGSHGAALLGRFCQSDPALHREVEALLAAEAALDPEAIFTEIVCVLTPRLGSLARRPVLRDTELPVVGRSGAPADRQLALSDLVLWLDRGRLEVWSRSRRRRVQPRMASALSVVSEENPGLVRLLAMLPLQEGLGVKFSWGPMASWPRLPRVVVGRTVLARARWSLSAEEVAPLASASRAARASVLAALRRDRRLPRTVGLVFDDDGAVPLDLESPRAADILAEDARRGPLVLTEWLSAGDTGAVTSPDGPHAHEIVVPFVRRRPRQSAPCSAATRAGTPTDDVPDDTPSVAVVGDRWIYVRLLGGPVLADRLLVSGIAPLVAAWQADGMIDGWFFLRYPHPEPELRLRVRGAPERLQREVMPRLLAAIDTWRRSGWLHDARFERYVREVARYGGHRGVALAEACFEHDSTAVIGALRLAGRAADRWRLAAQGVNALWADFGLDVEGRERLARQAADIFGREFGARASLWGQIGRTYRRERDTVQQLLADAPPPWIAARSAQLAALVPAWHAVIGTAGEPARDDWLRAMAHLHVTRMLRTAARAQEFVIMALLEKAYRSRRARTS